MENSLLNNIKPNQIYAIIPARAESKGIKNKNIKSLMGYPMIAYSIAAAKLCPDIQRVIVSTDSEQYAAIAKYYGAEAPFLRPKQYATDNSPDFEFMKHAIIWLSDNEKSLPEYFVHIRPTTPIRDVCIISNAIKSIVNDSDATSLRSSHACAETPNKWFYLDSMGYYQPIFDFMTVDEVNNPRQSFRPIYIPDGYVDVLCTEFIVKNDLLHGNKCKGFVVESGIDVDVQNDFDLAEQFLKHNDHELYRYLRKNFKELEK